MGYMLEIQEVDRPKNSDEKHAFKLSLIVIAPNKYSVDQIWQLAAAGIAKGGFDVVAGYGGEVLNITSTQDDGTTMAGPAMVLTGFKNKALPKGLEKLPVVRVRKTRVRKKKG